jgi:hypothetical protein
MVVDMIYDAQTATRWPRYEGAVALEPSPRTAAEDVTNVAALSSHFCSYGHV